MKAPTSVIVTAILASVAWLNLGRVAKKAWRIQQWSDVALPTQRMLDEIVAGFDRGEYEIAMQRLRSLRQHWTRYAEGGATPELFQQEVAAISMKTNTDGRANGSLPSRAETNRASWAAGSRR